MLHFILLGAYIPLVFAFEKWWMATVFAVSLIVVLFPALFFAQKIPMFSPFVNERKKGEFRSSMVYAVGMMACSTAVCWGLFGDKYLVLQANQSWYLTGISLLLPCRVFLTDLTVADTRFSFSAISPAETEYTCTNTPPVAAPTAAHRTHSAQSTNR